MTAKKTLSRKMLSIFLCFALMMTYLPLSVFTAGAASAADNPTADPSTLNAWTEFFPTDGAITTENAGGIWTDKSVLTDAGALNAELTGGSNVTMNDATNHLLVALSAIGSNMSITGQSSTPIDTMFVLDVSGSMQNDASALVSATNESIAELLKTSGNKVGITLFAGSQNYSSNDSASVVLLPLGEYTTAADNQYITLSGSGDNASISLDPDVVVKATGRRPSTTPKQVFNATYTQKGVMQAVEQFTSASNVIVTSEGRKPALILMTDGDPTLGSTAFTDPQSPDFGTGSASSAALGFVNQLSLAYAKEQIEEKYKTPALFYTLGLGTDGNAVSTNVLNPMHEETNEITEQINRYWKEYNDGADKAKIGLGTVSYIYRLGRNLYIGETDDLYVQKIDTALDRNYVDRAFSASQGSELAAVFRSIMAEIALQSAYHPTLIQGAEEFSGYVSFVDKIGRYMQVDSIKGVLYDGTLHTGEVLAQHFAEENTSAGSLLPYNRMSAFGKRCVDSVAVRLSVDTDTAYALIENAWDKGWISYNAPGDFSNRIGWLANASGAYIGIWDGTLPVADPNAVYINYSYAMAGSISATGDDTTDMMYSTIRVRERISNGEQEVNFAIPASLLPTITYKVSLKADKSFNSLVAEPDSPIRLVYEVGLNDAITPLNITELVDSTYLSQNTDTATGAVRFYSNQYETTPDAAGKLTGYGKVNTYSYFRPSRQNDRYYYQADSEVYTDQNGTKYVSATTHPSANTGATYYYRHQIYSTTEGIKVGYHKLPADLLKTAKHNTADNTYTISAGTVRADYAGTGIQKSLNATDTLNFSHEPFHDLNGAHYDDVTHRMVVGTTLANNGRLSLVPASGIKLTKSLTPDAAAPSAPFTFKLSAAGVTGDLAGYMVLANGTTADAPVRFIGGEATVTLEAGATLYIGGFDAGTTVLIEESETAQHTVHQVLVNGTTAPGKTASVAINAQTMQPVEFINGNRGEGSFTVTKVIGHPLGTDYTIPDNAVTNFAIGLELTDFAGNPLSGDFAGKYSSAANPETITFVDGKYTAQLTHHEQLQLSLPEGSRVKVTETLTDEQKTMFNVAPQQATFYENRTAVSGDFAEVAIAANSTASVMVENFYSPARVYPVNLRIEGTKVLSSSSVSTFTGDFNFALQKQIWDSASNAYVYETIATAKATYDGPLGEKPFLFDTAAFANEEYTAVGRYAYRVIEIPNAAQYEQGVNFDSTVHGFEVEVADGDMDGQLEIKAVHRARPATTGYSYSGGVHTVTTRFTNTIEQDATTADIEIRKTLHDGNNAPIANASGFKFDIAEITGGLPVDGAALTPTQMDALFVGASETAATAHSGITRFVKEFDTEGTYFFAIREKEMRENTVGTTGYTFDTHVEFVKVTIRRNTGHDILVAEAISVGSATLQPNGSYAVALADSPLNSAAPYMASVAFKNTYVPLPTSITPTVRKQLIGREWLDTDASAFRFELTPAYGSALYNSDGVAVSKLDGTLSLVNTAAGATNAVNFGSLVFKEVGTYFYNVRELPLTADYAKSMAADTAVYGVTVTVIDVDGQLQASYIMVDQDDNTAVTFVNRYTPSPVSTIVSGTKHFTDGTLIGDDFTFVMTNVADPSDTQTAKNATDGTFTFPALSFDAPGTYTYQVAESVPADGEKLPGVQYNPAGINYTVQIVVAYDQNGNLAIQSVSDNIDDIEITNTYVPGGAQATVEGTKVLLGERALLADEFEFALYAADAAWEKQGTDPIVPTAKNTADGRFMFQPLSYTGMTSIGIHRYLVEEVHGSRGGVDYDPTVYRVAVVVRNNVATGSLIAETFIFNENGQPIDGIVFTNTYNTAGSIAITGIKELNGRPQHAGEFSFDIYAVEDEHGTPVGNPLQTVQNSADGSFTFRLDGFAASGDYFFTVKERNTGVDGIGYDSASYLVKITLADDGVGRLSQSAPEIYLISDNGLLTADAVKFVNRFSDELTVPITVQKTVENKGSATITPEGFRFALNQDGVDQPLVKEAPASGVVEFDLTFSEADIGKVYTYTLSEINNSREHVKYSDARYTITVALSLDEHDNLVATLTKDSQAVDAVTAAFVNEYDYTPPVEEPPVEEPPVEEPPVEEPPVEEPPVEEPPVEEPPVEETPTEPEIPVSPQMGDSTNLNQWFILLFVSGGGLLGSSLLGKKKKQDA